jgi:hypothetical protein
MDFFISYTGVDKSWAEWMAWELEKETFECVLQAWDFVAGGNFIQRMQEASTNAKRTIAVLSPEYLKSRYGVAEMNAAIVNDPLGDQRKLIPVRVRECEPAGLLSGRIYIDLVGKSQDEARMILLDGIRASLLGRAKPPEAPQFPGVPVFPGAEQGSVPVPPVVSRTADSNQGATILFLGSAAGIALDLKGELNQIEAALAATPAKTRIRVKSAFDVKAEDLFNELNATDADIFHFSGNMHRGDVLLHAEAGGVRTVTKSALVGVIRVAGSKMKLAILNACDSLDCAEALAETIGCAIGVHREIMDSEAILYSKSFYAALGHGKSIQACHEQAVLALEMAGTPATRFPQLRSSKGVDPAMLHI